MVDVGSHIPDFEVPIVRGEHSGDEFRIEDTLHVETFSLSEALEAAPIVLAFFPGAFTPVCWDEMQELQDALEELDDLGVHLYGVSVDTPFAQNKFIDDCELSFPLLSDLDKELIELFDVVSDDFSDLEQFGYEYVGHLTTAKRSIFALNTDGVVTYKWVSDSPLGLPDIEELKRAMKDVA